MLTICPKRVYLSNETPSTISWIGSTQLFLDFAVGLPTGKLYDAGYFRSTMAAGSLLYVFSSVLPADLLYLYSITDLFVDFSCYLWQNRTNTTKFSCHKRLGWESGWAWSLSRPCLFPHTTSDVGALLLWASSLQVT